MNKRSSDERIRVLHIVADPMTGVKIVASIAQRQAALGYQVDFVSGPGEFFGKLQELNFSLTIVPIERKLISITHVLTAIQLWKLLRKREYHVVHTHTPVAAFLGRIVAALAGVPIIFNHMRGSWWDSTSFIKRTTFTILEWIAGRWTTHTFTINCNDANELVTRRIASPERVTCLHCGGGGVNTKHFDISHLSDEQKVRLRAKLGIKSSDFVIGFVGRLVREKGVFELLRAFKEVSRVLLNGKLLFVGGVLSSERDQGTIEKMQSFIHSDYLTVKTIFTGFRDDISNLLGIMDLLVLPSYREGFGMVLAEAAAMARPVITTQTRGGREAVIHGKNGFLLPIGDSNALRDAILRLGFDRELRQRMGEEGRRLALERFDERLVFEKVKAEYAKLLREKGLRVPKHSSN